MKTECAEKTEFQGLGNRQVIGKFDGGIITSDGGGILLREAEERTGIVRRFSDCFTDYRNQDRIEHTVAELTFQRIMGLALGYEDINDHDMLRCDPLIALISGKEDPTGSDRRCERDRGKALAGKSTLNRMELTPGDADEKSRYKKITADHKAMDELFPDLFIEAHPTPPGQIIPDADATDDPLHGDQEGKFFHGYYKCYCYLPLYIFCEGHLLCARLRPSNIDASRGTTDELERIVGRIRQAWPEVEITVRGDSGFCREEIMSWCEMNDVDYVFGLAKNSRLTKLISEEMSDAEAVYEETGEAAKVYGDFYYTTLETWTECRRVVGKAEYLPGGENPRFVVTSLDENEISSKDLYEELYCGRGDMENRIKEQQLFLFADRTSTSEMRSNQLRLYFSSFAYVLMHALRRLGLAGTEMEKSQCDTIRLKILKIGAQIRITVRKVWISFSETYPHREMFQRIYNRIAAIPVLS